MTISAWNENFKIRSKILLTKVKMDNQIENSIKNERFCIKIFAILFDFFHNNLQYDLHHTNNVTSFLCSIICFQKWKFLHYGQFRTFFHKNDHLPEPNCRLLSEISIFLKWLFLTNPSISEENSQKFEFRLASPLI